MGKLGDYLMVYSQKSGIIHTEYPQAANLLELYMGAEKVGVEKVNLDGHNERVYTKLKVDDLKRAYRIITSFYMQNW